MKRTRFATEQIIMNLRKMETMVGQEKTAQEAYSEIGIRKQTYYQWRNKYGNTTTSDSKKLKALGKENERLKKTAAGLSIDNAVLKEDVEGRILKPCS